MRPRALLAAVVLAALPGAAAAQALSQRIGATGDGTVRFSFDVRSDVRICERGVRMGDQRVHWSSGDDWEDERCEAGPARVEVRMRDGRVRDVDLLDLRERPAPDATDLGLVPASQAVAYLMGVARGEAGENAAEDAVFPAAIADVPEVWRDLMELARDGSAPGDSRRNALFWIGQEAADAATEGLAGVALDEDEDQEVRDAAIFALSQRPSDEGVPVLMELARTAEQAKTRRSAMFWLAQSEDERVLAFFQEVLLGRGG